MINYEQLAEMLTTNQSRTLYVLLTRQHIEQNELTIKAWERYRDDDKFRNGVAQSVGGIMKIVTQTYHQERGIDQRELGRLLTSQQGVLIHGVTSGQIAADNEMDIVDQAAKRYTNEPAFTELVAQSVGAIMSVVMHCDSKDNLVEVPKFLLEDEDDNTSRIPAPSSELPGPVSGDDQAEPGTEGN